MSTAELSMEQEDRSRVDRLYEEIEGRLTEMALILTRSAIQRNPDFAGIVKSVSTQPIIQFRKLMPTDRTDMKGVEIKSYGCGPGMTLVYDHDAGVCYVM
jgi:hypothetical protein